MWCVLLVQHCGVFVEDLFTQRDKWSNWNIYFTYECNSREMRTHPHACTYVFNKNMCFRSGNDTSLITSARCSRGRAIKNASEHVFNARPENALVLFRRDITRLFTRRPRRLIITDDSPPYLHGRHLLITNNETSSGSWKNLPFFNPLDFHYTSGCIYNKYFPYFNYAPEG